MTHEYPTVSKFHNDWVKIVEFLIKAYFCLSLSLPGTQCMCQILIENQAKIS